MLYLEDGMYSYGEMSFESHVSVPNIMLGLQDSMISSTSGFMLVLAASGNNLTWVLYVVLAYVDSGYQW
jgi:hypothetical protein